MSRIPVSCKDPRHGGVPNECENHPLLAGRTFYTLPLLDCLESEGATDRCDDDVLKLERALSERIGDHGYSVGFHNAAPVQYEFLGERKRLDFDPEVVERLNEKLGWTADAKRRLPNTLRLGTERLDHFGRPIRAYAGADAEPTVSRRARQPARNVTGRG